MSLPSVACYQGRLATAIAPHAIIKAGLTPESFIISRQRGARSSARLGIRPGRRRSASLFHALSAVVPELHHTKKFPARPKKPNTSSFPR